MYYSCLTSRRTFVTIALRFPGSVPHDHFDPYLAACHSNTRTHIFVHLFLLPRAYVAPLRLPAAKPHHKKRCYLHSYVSTTVHILPVNPFVAMLLKSKMRRSNSMCSTDQVGVPLEGSFTHSALTVIVGGCYESLRAAFDIFRNLRYFDEPMCLVESLLAASMCVWL